MELLRWILLGAGLLFILILYMLGRSRKGKGGDVDDIDIEDIPPISLDDVADGELADVNFSATGSRIQGDHHLYTQDPDEQASEDAESDDSNEAAEIISVTVLARDEEGLHGDQLNSAFIANKLFYGHMSIFHRMGIDAKPQFSVANLLEPGSFDPETIHDMRTPGLMFFLQLPVFGSAMEAYTEMLQCAYKISELLGADLCDQRRRPLTESEAERLRTIAKRYDSETV